MAEFMSDADADCCCCCRLGVCGTLEVARLLSITPATPETEALVDGWTLVEDEDDDDETTPAEEFGTDVLALGTAAS